MPDAEPAATVTPVGRQATLATVLGAFLGVLGLAIGLGRLGDNSFFTHLATGRLILADGRVPTTDPYSFTGHGEPWVVQSWLASVVFAGVEQVGGLVAIRVVLGLTAGGLALLVWRLCRPADAVIGRLALAGAAVGIGTEHWIERPLIFGLACFAVTLVVVDDGLDPRWLVPVMWLWVNTHGSFPLGVLAVAVLAVGRRLDRERPVVELRALRWMGVGLAAAAVNPLGLRLLTFPLGLLRRGEAFRSIVEWQPPNFETLGQRLFLVQVMAAVVLLVRRPSYRAALPIAVFATMAVLASRNVPQASLLLLPGMATAVASMGSIDGRRRARAHTFATVALVVAGLVLSAAVLARPTVQDESYPLDALAWLERRDQIAPDVRLVTRDYVGNYLEARYGPDRVQVFMDDRVDMYPLDVSCDYTHMLAGDRGWDRALGRHRAELVVWNRDEVLTQLLEASPAWRLIYRDQGWVVAVPADSPLEPGSELERAR